jgi:outer membrane protein
MKKSLIIPLMLAAVFALKTPASAESLSFGVVNYGNCATDSKYGKQEFASFESLRKQMTALLEDTHKQIADIENKLKDPEYKDSLSPEAEEEMRNKFYKLNEDLSQYQNQYQQVMMQTQMRMQQMLTSQINSASEQVAKEKKLSMVFNKEICPFALPSLDVTQQVIQEMDKRFEQTAKEHAAAVATAEANASEAKPTGN